MVALLFVILFIAVPVIELWLILQVGEMIGAGPTIALLVIDSLIGAWLVRNQGGSAWRRFRLATDAGRIPANEAVDGFMIILGGTLLLLPGFLTDFVGLAFVLPPTRILMRTRVVSFVGRRTHATFMSGSVADDMGMRDFAHSEQPRRRDPASPIDLEPEFDLKPHKLPE